MIRTQSTLFPPAQLWIGMDFYFFIPVLLKINTEAASLWFSRFDHKKFFMSLRMKIEFLSCSAQPPPTPYETDTQLLPVNLS